MAPSPDPHGATARENELVLACASTALDRDRRARIRELAAEDLDWDLVQATSTRHYVTPLVRESLVATCADMLPARVRQSFDLFFREHAARNLGLVAELVRLTRRFDAAGIDIITFKGPALSVLAYGNHVARLYGDLDLLVPEPDVPAAIDLLVEAGYVDAGDSEVRAHRSQWTPYTKDLVFVNAAIGSRVELHWRLTGSHFPFPVDLDKLRRRAASVQIGGVRVRTIPADDLLLYLCLHGGRHGWERLEWVCDVAELVRSQPAWDWERLEARAAKLGCTRNLRLGLLLANRLVGGEVPSDVLARISRDPAVIRVAENATAGMFEEPGREIGGWRGYHLSVRERLSDRIRLHLYYLYRYARLATHTPSSEQTSDPATSRAEGRLTMLRPFRLGYRYGMVPAVRRLISRFTKQKRGDWDSHAPDAPDV